MKLNHDGPLTEKGEHFDIHVLWPFLLTELADSQFSEGFRMFGCFTLLFCKQGRGVSKLLARI